MLSKREKWYLICRQDKPISDKIISKLIRNAHRAPSAGHSTGSGIYHSQKSFDKEKAQGRVVDQGIC